MNSVELYFSSSEEDEPVLVRPPRANTNILELSDKK